MTTGKALEQYTDTDRTDHEIALRVLYDALEGRTYDNRISGSDLAERVPVAQSTVYDLIQELRQEWGLPVYSRGGYWCVQDPEQLDEIIEQINDQINTMQKTKQDLCRNYNRRER
ncbi:hypothetical protein OSG_eHP1_00170 [environmental Halophage eHP-1]|nr:hypothetical protein OSG_eHP1_00170 [environmental Halophage eHP-1]AFH22213.1 hypothetical protein OSG_eHP19_00040 [environmental Halophage eHP-19]